MFFLKPILLFCLIFTVRSEDLLDYLPKFEGENWMDILRYIMSMGEHFLPHTKPGEFPYFNVFPHYLAHVVPNGGKF